MKIGKVENVNLEHRLFEISSTESSRSFYKVRICTQPSCSCPDFNRYGSKVFCKHILFVLYFALGVTDIDKLNKFGFQADEVSEILKNTVIDPQFKKTKAKKGGNRGKVDYQNILSSHENANDEQTF